MTVEYVFQAELEIKRLRKSNADLLAALEGMLTVDWNLERGDFYDPTTYTGKVWANVRKAIAQAKEE